MKTTRILTTIFFIALISISCEFFDPTTRYTQINPINDIDVTVNHIEVANGYVLNNQYYYSGGYFIQKNNVFPKWIPDEIASSDGALNLDENCKLHLDITDIKTPFRLFKKKHSNVLNLVKNNDTLQFIVY